MGPHGFWFTTRKCLCHVGLVFGKDRIYVLCNLIFSYLLLNSSHDSLGSHGCASHGNCVCKPGILSKAGGLLRMDCCAIASRYVNHCQLNNHTESYQYLVAKIIHKTGDACRLTCILHILHWCPHLPLCDPGLMGGCICQVRPVNKNNPKGSEWNDIGCCWAIVIILRYISHHFTQFHAAEWSWGIVAPVCSLLPLQDC